MDLLESSQNNLAPSSSIPEKANTSPASVKIIIISIIIALVFGAIGGAAGAFLLLKQPFGQKFLGMGQINNQKISVNEDSAVIEVVKQAGPAVVSIIISQDLNKIPGYGLSPFSQDPFYNFFGGQSQQQPSTPNVQEVGAGSGFFVSADGLILTNKHVVSDTTASYTVITSDGKKYDAQVLARDPVNDLAIVKIKIQNAPFLKFSGGGSLQVGQRVIAIGNSLGQYQNTVTTGIVSGIGRSITAGGNDGSENLSGVIQTDAAINPGNSGGPLLNISGQVIGINTAIDQQGQLVGFAIPAGEAGKALASFQKNGKITRPFLGVRYITLTADIAQQNNLPQDHGALIVRGQNITDFAVQPGSPADKAGLMENDIILQVNGQTVDENHLLSDLLQNFNPGDSVSLQVYHKGKTENINVTLSESK
jgi:serine protease Do